MAQLCLAACCYCQKPSMLFKCTEWPHTITKTGATIPRLGKRNLEGWHELHQEALEKVDLGQRGEKGQVCDQQHCQNSRRINLGHPAPLFCPVSTFLALFALASQPPEQLTPKARAGGWRRLGPCEYATNNRRQHLPAPLTQIVDFTYSIVTADSTWPPS